MISGPKIELPSTLAQMFTYDEQGQITGLTPQWAQFFHALEGLVKVATKSGASTDRPTSTMQWRYTGMPFFDTTLGLTIFLKTASSNAWVKADGTAA